MNILHISRTMGQGGAEKVVSQLCREKNHNELFVASTGGVLVKDLKEANVEHFIIPDIDSKSPLIIIKTFFILKKIIKEKKINIVHSHHRMAAFYSRVLNLFNKDFKRIYTAHSVFYNKKHLMRFALKGSRIVAVGNGVKKNLIDFYDINPNSVEVIFNSIKRPNIINIPNDDFIKNKKDKIYVGTIGRISHEKGMDLFIASMANIIKENKNVYGIIIGDGEERGKLVEQTKILSIEDNIIFLGYREDIFDLIKAMDFIVISSRQEGFPLTPIETLSVGKTIIVSNIDGNKEIINGKNGLLFEKENIEDLQNKIEKLCYDVDFRHELEKEALKDFEEKFSYDNFIEKYRSIYLNMDINKY